jgi:hypothetical protein
MTLPATIAEYLPGAGTLAEDTFDRARFQGWNLDVFALENRKNRAAISLGNTPE